ncbi:hypothetical protein FZEAL_2371 [Fusarium zealandicum]|uniref:WSC domain-containing protein n=1 Tax=Fusarium zealandicum TaxID=1053134 RepID=A0A8H4UR70_9HYPO|nr:hypothetical protein FZEAL_2371 [Fusarium zealandicum]
MKTTTITVGALAAFSNFATSAAKGIQYPVVNPVIGQLTSQGCFSSVGNMTKLSLKDKSKVTFGYCGQECLDKKALVMAVQADSCYCGMVYPPEDDFDKDNKCDYPCPAYPKEACGALRGYWSVANTGIELAVDYYEEEASTTSAASSTSAAASTSAQDSAVATQTKDAESPQDSSIEDGKEEEEEKKKKDGPNVAAIAAGVVVGVVVVAAIIGGAIFFVRRRRNAEIEEEHRRNAAVNAFINGSKPPGSSGSISMTDSRLDPVMAHRRLSDGSIADNQDYSRRILRVTNA